MDMMAFSHRSWILLPLLLSSSNIFITAQATETGGSCDVVDQVTDLQERLICVEHTLDAITGGHGPHQRAFDCADVYRQMGHAVGQYSIWRGDDMPPFDVTCHVDEQGAWTWIQRRVGGDVDFMRNWTEYRDGFGNQGFSSNSWLGLEKVHQMTKYRSYTLRVDLVDWNEQTSYAEFSNFRLTGESDGYRLRFDSYSGTAGDSLSWDNGIKFSSYDRDNDNYGGNCALMFGGWWHNACSYSNLNGVYREPPNHTGSIGVPPDNTEDPQAGIQWWHWKSAWYSLKEATMRMRPQL